MIQYVGVGKRYSSEIKMLREILKGVDLSGERFLADRLYDVRWLRGYLERKGVKGVIRVRRDRVGREDVGGEEYKERNEIEGLFGNLKMKLSGYVAAYREDMAMVLALVRFLAYNMYVVYFVLIFSRFYLIFLPLLPRFLKHRLLPLDFFDSVKFLNFKSKEGYVMAYSVTDGIPLYLMEFSGYEDFQAALLERVLSPGEYLVEEGKFLTLEEFKKDPSNYYSILLEIAQGKTTPGEIADASGIDHKSVGVYLSKLVDLGLVVNEYPFSLYKKPKRKPHYSIADEYLRFYFRYIYPNKELIYRGLREKLLERIVSTLNQHVSFTFEKIARQYLTREVQVEKVGRWWGEGQEIDIVAIKGGTLYVAECEWSNKKVDNRTLNRLKSKVPYLLKDLQVDDLSIVYYLFSKSGFENLKESDDVKLVSLDDLL